MPALLALLTAVLGLIGQLMHSHERVLDERGVVDGAVVVEVRHRRPIDKVVVDYRVGGVPFRTTLPVGSAGDFEVGSTIGIRLDPLHPDHARPLVGWMPMYRILWSGAAAAGLGTC